MDALALAKAHQLDAVVLDIALPKLDGFYVAELWRRDPVMSRVPVVAVSSCIDADYERRALRSGCAAALKKPCTPEELMTAIEQLLV